MTRKCKSILAGLLVSALLVLSSISANSQYVAGGNIGVGIPVGNFGTSQTIGVGFNLFGGYSFFEDQMQAGVDFSFVHFFGEELNDTSGKSIRTNLIPIALYYSYAMPFGKIKPYARLDVSMNIYMRKYVFEDFDSFTNTFVMVGVAPSLGCEYELNEKFSLFAAAKMSLAQHKNYFSFNVGTVCRLDFLMK